MDSNTLNGFEVFEDFMMPGNNVNSNRMPGNNENEFEGASEELTDEELEELRKGNKSNKEEEEDVDDPKNKPSKKSKPEDNEEEEEEEEEDNEHNDDPDNNIDNNQGEDIESNAVTSFFEALSDKMGWELDEDEEIPQTPEELVEYFKDVIEENSVPQYASEEVEALDNFVKNGGNLRDYFQIDGDLDLEEINIEDRKVKQKLIIKEYLKEKSFNAKQNEKKLTTCEEAGLLEDEATDALEALRDIKEQKKQELLEAQEKRAKELK